ncbi:MAG: hypothetical protein K2L07_06665 [Lachnospiraceae bacterium]|nr:hypothetical protein [Lachnospiraceae bacterium]
MDVSVQITGKKVVKVLGAACLATGVVALSAVVASGAAVGAVVEGFKSAKNTMQKILKEDENVAVDEAFEESSDVAEEIIETATTDKVLAESSNMTEEATKEA